MGFLKDQIKQQITNKIREQIALKQQEELPIPKTVGSLLSNVGRGITEFSKGIVGMGYQGIRHPIETVKTAGAGLFELGKELPSAAGGLSKQIAKTVTQPVKTTKELISGIQKLHQIPYEEQKKLFNDITENALQQDERGKKALGVLGSGVVGSGIKERSQPGEYA